MTGSVMSFLDPTHTAAGGRVGHFLEDMAGYYGNRQAVMDLEARVCLSYVELNRLSDQFAVHLSQELHLEKGDQVAILDSNSVPVLALICACLKLGVVAVPVNPRLPPDLGKQCAELVSIAAVFHGPLDKRVSALLEMLATDGCDVVDMEALVRQPAMEAEMPTEGSVDNSPSDIALMTATSGTTGKFKLCKITFDQIRWNLMQAIMTRGSWNEGRTVITYPLSSIAGLLRTLSALANGWDCVIKRETSPSVVTDLIERGLIKHLVAPPGLLSALLGDKHCKAAATGSLEAVWVTGEYCSEDLLKPFWDKGAFAGQAYGMTEVGPVSYFPRIRRKSAVLRRDGTSVGVPYPFIDLKIVNPQTGEETELGEEGLLIIRGPQMFAGYLDMWNLTDIHLASNGWFFTRDLAVEDELGYLRIVRRLSEHEVSPEIKRAWESETSGVYNWVGNALGKLARVYGNSPAFRMGSEALSYAGLYRLCQTAIGTDGADYEATLSEFQRAKAQHGLEACLRYLLPTFMGVVCREPTAGRGADDAIGPDDVAYQDGQRDVTFGAMIGRACLRIIEKDLRFGKVVVAPDTNSQSEMIETIFPALMVGAEIVIDG